jgi:hypothetical protein
MQTKTNSSPSFLPRKQFSLVAVLYGISVGDGEIVSVALSQVGNVGGQPYWSWYGFNGRVNGVPAL